MYPVVLHPVQCLHLYFGLFFFVSIKKHTIVDYIKYFLSIIECGRVTLSTIHETIKGNKINFINKNLGHSFGM